MSGPSRCLHQQEGLVPLLLNLLLACPCPQSPRQLPDPPSGPIPKRSLDLYMFPSRSRSALTQDGDQPRPAPTPSASQSEQGQVRPWASNSGSAQQVPLSQSVSDSSAISSRPCLPPLLPTRPELRLSVGEGGSPRPPVSQEPLSGPQRGRGPGVRPPGSRLGRPQSCRAPTSHRASPTLSTVRGGLCF